VFVVFRVCPVSSCVYCRLCALNFLGSELNCLRVVDGIGRSCVLCVTLLTNIVTTGVGIGLHLEVDVFASDGKDFFRRDPVRVKSFSLLEGLLLHCENYTSHPLFL